MLVGVNVMKMFTIDSTYTSEGRDTLRQTCWTVDKEGHLFVHLPSTENCLGGNLVTACTSRYDFLDDQR